MDHHQHYSFKCGSFNPISVYNHVVNILGQSTELQVQQTIQKNVNQKLQPQITAMHKPV
jgi:hypothetical protein